MKIPSLKLSTDAEKALDRIEWSFIRVKLEYIGLGPHILSWILALYADPKAQARANGILSDSFAIFNGTRQGCPLSPLVFILTLEPFLRKIRLNQNVKGICIGQERTQSICG